VNRARVAGEFKRTYHSRARQKFVNLMPCAACGVWGHSQNAHVLGVDGAGRKGPYTSIAPLCGARFDGKGGVWPGCHHVFDTAPEKFRELFPTFNPAKAARATEKAWRKFLAGEPISPEGAAKK
jgi:hypothetical protein